jgi:GNAT superfamily N-acetyltransferase
VSAPVIRRATREDLAGLVGLLEEAVGAGAAVGFMAPLSRERAAGFWSGVFAAAERGERVVLVAEGANGTIVGTVQLVLALPDNQPHRGDVAKMQVSPEAQKRGIGRALLAAIEDEARRAGRSVLVLDTATGSPAEGMYASAGWQRVGVIPHFALWPDGASCASTFFYKVVGPVPRQRDEPSG